MSYDQFLSRYNGYGIDWDGYYGDQCMDLIQLYAEELGLPRFWGNAADVANQYPAGWLHVSQPQRGDVVVFARNAANGGNGHIAIYDRPGYYFSQNYPTGTVSHLQYINEPIIAILRPIGANMAEETVPKKKYDDDIANNQRAALEARRGLIAHAYLYYLGRPIKDSEYKHWENKTPTDIVNGIKNSAEAKEYQKNKTTIEKQKLIDYINNN